MSDICSGALGSQRCRSRVGEQIQNLRLGACLRGDVRSMLEYVVPVCGLLREDSHVLEGREPQPEAELRTSVVADPPLIRHIPKPFPRSAVLLPGLAESGPRREAGVGEPVPLLVGHALVPQSLRLRAGKNIFTEPFELRAPSGVEKFVVLPILWIKLDRHSVQR